MLQENTFSSAILSLNPDDSLLGSYPY